MQSVIRRRDIVASVLALVVLTGYLLLPPISPLDKADHAAFAVCHRIAERSFIFGDRPLPLCARCSGLYLGATGTLAATVLMGRSRSGRFPARRMWIPLAAFVLAWAIDGANSFLALIPGLPHLYEPRNLLRLTTGTLQGVVLAVILLPALNLALWRSVVQRSAVESWRDILVLVGTAALLTAPVASEWAPLLYPLALLSGLTILLLLGAVNTMLALVIMRREAQATRKSEIIGPVLLGLAFACVELAGIAAFRTFVTSRFGLPF